MNTFIIILNLLLFSLILHNIIGKTNKIIESLDECPKDTTNIVYSCKQKLDRFFNEMTSVKAQLERLDNSINKQKQVIRRNKKVAQATTQKAADGLSNADASTDNLPKKFGI